MLISFTRKYTWCRNSICSLKYFLLFRVWIPFYCYADLQVFQTKNKIEVLFNIHYVQYGPVLPSFLMDWKCTNKAATGLPRTWRLTCDTGELPLYCYSNIVTVFTFLGFFFFSLFRQSFFSGKYRTSYVGQTFKWPVTERLVKSGLRSWGALQAVHIWFLFFKGSTIYQGFCLLLFKNILIIFFISVSFDQQTNMFFKKSGNSRLSTTAQ